VIELPTEAEPVRVIRGDSLQVMQQLPAGSIDSVITDPPYCSGAATEVGRGSATHQGLRSETMRSGRFEWFDADNMTTSGLVWFLRSMAVEADRLLKPTGSLLAFCDWRMAFSIGPAMESAGFRMRNLIVWDKGSFGCGCGFRPQHELVLHLTRRAPDFFAADVGNVIRSKRVRSSEREHPAEKPVELIRDLVRVVTPPGGIVLDPCAGSGAILLAAVAEARRAIGIDKDANYVGVMNKRTERAQARQQGSLFADEGEE
jgi:DNA modification methylase